MKILEEGSYRDEEVHYVIPLLWEDLNTQLPNNVYVAHRSLDRLRKFLKDLVSPRCTKLL